MPLLLKTQEKCLASPVFFSCVSFGIISVGLLPLPHSYETLSSRRNGGYLCQIIYFLFFEKSSKISTISTGILNEGLRPGELCKKDVVALDDSKQRTIQHQFDAYVKKALRGEVNDHKSELARLSSHETLFSELPDGMLESLCTYDEYPCEQHCFSAAGQSITVRSDALADAISELSARKRDVLLMAYCLGFSDAEIASLLNLMASTVHYHRTSSLKQIKRQMGVKNEK